MDAQLTAIIVASIAAAVSVGAERLHLRRLRGASRLAFGPSAAPRRWTKAILPLRAIACAGLAWGMTTLLLLAPRPIESAAKGAHDDPQPIARRLVLLLDVSPSMDIADSGPDRDLRRRDRLMQVLEAIFPRIAISQTRFTVIAFFTSARPVVVDARDLAVVRNILDNLPLLWSFEPGQTQILQALRMAAELAEPWPPDSTTLFLCTDGDTVDFDNLPPLPPSIDEVRVLAVGDPVAGTFIDGHQSRQEAGLLRRLAAELGGSYYDVNAQHVPTTALRGLAPKPAVAAESRFGLRELALWAIAGGSLLLVVIPVALEYWGSDWKPNAELPMPQRPLGPSMCVDDGKPTK